MTALSEAFALYEIQETGTSSLRDLIMWPLTLQPSSSIVLAPWRDLSDEAKNALSKIKTFANLRENWDSYGAMPPSKIALQNALSFVMAIDKQQIPVFFTAPGPNGEVLVELKENDKYVEVTFEEDGTASYAKFRGEAFVEEDILANRILPDLATWLSS